MGGGAVDVAEKLSLALADRYTLERELGQGGMATVYLAEDLKHHRKVALKVLRPELAAALGPERFLREITTTAQLTHPHILPLLDSGAAEGTLFYVMPFVEGESLRDRLTREKQLPLEDALQIAREVADALSYAHSHGVIHRDIKPENILLQSGHAVVADFGIAKAVAAAGSQRLTETGLAVGTPAYMSPEQAAGSQDLDGRSDVYSLGCVLYEMLGGEPPYIGLTPQLVIAKKLSEPLPRISVVRETVPPGVEAVLSRALARTPADRFVTAADFAAALAHPDTMRGTSAAPRPVSWRRRAVQLATALAAVAFLAGAAAIGRWLLPGRTGAHHPRTAIAVLPLENLSAQGPNAYFAGGPHDELLTQLGKVAALSVRARTSVMGYAGTTKPLKQIAAELSAGSIVEGSVQVVGNRLRVIVQLIDPATEAHIWAETYDRTLDDAFAVQSEIAQRIVEAVGTTLTAAEASAIAAAPTRNVEAYQLYLQGLECDRRAGYRRENWEVAQHLYERSLALDSTFALAHAALSRVHGWMFWLRYDPTPARAELQRREAERAIRLAPTLPQARVAMALADYWGRRDYRSALEQFNIALRGAPNDAELWTLVGAVQRRLGNWDSVDVAFARASVLDPRNANLFAEIGNTYVPTRRYADAVRAFDRAVRLAPDLSWAAAWKGLTYVRWKGELDTLRVFLRGLPPGADLGANVGTASFQRSNLLLWERQPDSLLSLLRGVRETVFQNQESFLPRSLYAAWAHQQRGSLRAARAAFDSALVLLDSAAGALPDDWRVHVARGLTLAGLGRRLDALQEARWIEQSIVYGQDAYTRVIAEGRAMVLADAGQPDAALEEIERLLAGPSWLSVHTLRLDPRWDPIRSEPRFRALLVKYATPRPVDP